MAGSDNSGFSVWCYNGKIARKIRFLFDFEADVAHIRFCRNQPLDDLVLYIHILLIKNLSEAQYFDINLRLKSREIFYIVFSKVSTCIIIS